MVKILRLAQGLFRLQSFDLLPPLYLLRHFTRRFVPISAVLGNRPQANGLQSQRNVGRYLARRGRFVLYYLSEQLARIRIGERRQAGKYSIEQRPQPKNIRATVEPSQTPD